MNFQVYFKNQPNVDEREFEIVERKGIGHPDTLSDFIAESISREYSKYCLDKFGCILPHMIDKIGLVGGLSESHFGDGKIVKPMKLLLTGRLTTNFKSENIPYKDIAINTAKNVLSSILVNFDPEKDLEIQDNLHTSRGPGVVASHADGNERSRFYTPHKEGDVLDLQKKIYANDTSTAVGLSPLSIGERLALYVENKLNSKEFKIEHPYVGTDVKVMIVRIKNNVEITTCIPFISTETPDFSFYKEKKDLLKDILLNDLKSKFEKYNFAIHINTRDNYEKPDIYLTTTGSAIESGDEGLVGRGNRVNGVISFTRQMTLEAYHGKNPVHHVGKVYTAICNKVANEIHKAYNVDSEVFLVSQMGRDLSDPWFAFITSNGAPSDSFIKESQELLVNTLNDKDTVRQQILSGEIEKICQQ